MPYNQPTDMSSKHVLLIAPDSDLKHSLSFALEAEHFAVTWRASIGAPLMPGKYGCTVVDHHALGDDLPAAERFMKAFWPVVLLANQAHVLSPLAFKTIVKPGLGAPLIEAVRGALEGAAGATK